MTIDMVVNQFLSVQMTTRDPSLTDPTDGATTPVPTTEPWTTVDTVPPAIAEMAALIVGGYNTGADDGPIIDSVEVFGCPQVRIVTRERLTLGMQSL